MHQSPSLPYIQLILLLVSLLIGPIVLGGIRPWMFLPPFFILSLVAGIGLFRALIDLRHRSWRPDLIDSSVALFTLYTIGCAWFSPIEYDSRLEMLKVIAYAITFFTFRYGIQRRFQGMTILYFLIATGLGVSLFGFFLKGNMDFRPFGETFHVHYAPRLTGTYGCPNHIGYFLVVTISIALSIGFFSHLSWVVRIITLYSAIPMVIALGFTLSRGSWVAMAFALFAIMLFSLRLEKIKRWIPISFFLLLIMGAGAFIYSNKDFNRRLTEGFDAETLLVNKEYCRVQLFLDCLKIAKDYPLFGSGPATFLYEHPRYQGATYPTLAVFAHNDYANTLADYGTIGLLLCLLFVILVSIKLSRHPRQTEEWHDRVFLSSAAAITSALIIHSFLDFNLHIPANALISFAIIGLGLRLTNRSVETSSKGRLRFVPLLGALLILTYFIYELQKTASGYFPLWSLQRQEASVPFEQRIPILEKSAKNDPRSTVIATTLGDLYRQEAAQNIKKEIRFPLAIKSIYWYDKARRLNPIDDTITVRLAMAHDLMERYMEAYQYYLLAVTNQPYSGYFWVELASHYWRQGLLLKAMEAYEAALLCPYKPENIGTEIQLLHQEIMKARERVRIEKDAPVEAPIPLTGKLTPRSFQYSKIELNS